MELEKIMDMWKNDCKMDGTNLDAESLKIPVLHSKYLTIYTQEKIALGELEKGYPEIFRKRREAVLSKNGKKPDYDISITRSDLDKYYVDADQVIEKYKIRIVQQKEKVEFLKEVLYSVNQRSFVVNNAIKWAKFQAGLSD